VPFFDFPEWENAVLFFLISLAFCRRIAQYRSCEERGFVSLGASSANASGSLTIEIGGQ
jgi:hypothetical protein